MVVIGTGVFAQLAYLPALRFLTQAGKIVVRALVDAASPTDPAKSGLHEAFPEALVATSVNTLPPLPGAFVLIATAPRFHAAAANAAFKRGWHVFCASPLAPQAAEAAAIIAAAQHHERLLAVDLRTRFFPALLFLRALCEDHLLGPPLSFQIHIGATHYLSPESIAAEKYTHPDGALTALGGPVFELLSWCFGTAAVLRYADDAMGGVEANAAIELSFQDRLRGTIHLTRDWPVEDRYTFVFERGVALWRAQRVDALSLQLASAPAALHAELGPAFSTPTGGAPGPRITTADEACAAQLENFIFAIAGQATLRTPATEAMHSLPLVDACYAQRTPLAQPWLSRNDALHARALSPPATLRRRA